jgi:hypothetical protein
MDTMAPAHTHNKLDGNREKQIQFLGLISAKIKTYLPLLVIVFFSFVFALVHTDSVRAPAILIHYAMGYFLCFLAMFKLFDINSFADGFQMYDLVAKKCHKYAYCYPFIELSLGLGFLTNFMPLVINSLTVLIMSISALGVIKSIRTGMNIKCACLGTVLSVPLSTVSVIENVGMGLMALVNLIIILG